MVRGQDKRWDTTLLREEFQRIKSSHRPAVQLRAGRVSLGASVIRVFERGTKAAILQRLDKIDLDALLRLESQRAFEKWFRNELNALARVIKVTNGSNPRIHPGYKWGHGTKILALYTREIVLNSRYFNDREAKRISPWLYVPIDGVMIRHLRKLNMYLPFRKIKEIDTAQRFFAVQNALGKVAEDVGVPRVWLDDVWGERE